jgi:hypothetical protein
MRTVLLGTVLGLTLALSVLGSAAAGPSPGGGPAFGEHVADMAPAHPVDLGRDFGGCVSELATTGECSEHD